MLSSLMRILPHASKVIAIFSAVDEAKARNSPGGKRVTDNEAVDIAVTAMVDLCEVVADIVSNPRAKGVLEVIAANIPELAGKVKDVAGGVVDLVDDVKAVPR